MRYAAVVRCLRPAAIGEATFIAFPGLSVAKETKQRERDLFGCVPSGRS